MLQRLSLLVASIALCGVIVLSYFTFSQSKLVYVDSNKLVNDYKGMIDARAAYQKKAAVWKANVDTLSLEVQQQIMDFEKSASKLTTKERQLTEELIRTKQKQLYDYQQAMNTQAQQEDAKMTNEVVAAMNAYIKKYGEQKGYRIVLAATQYGNIAYANEDLDITREVLEGLNAEYQGR